MFFNAISQIKPNLIIFSGLHLLEAQTKELRDEKMRLIKRSLLQISLSMPIHFQLGNIADKSHALNILTKIIPYVDSLSINDQELALLANVGNGPSTKQYPHGAQIHAYKVLFFFIYFYKLKFKNNLGLGLNLNSTRGLN